MYAGLSFAATEELANMFELQQLYIPNRQLDLIESYGLNPQMQLFKSWLQKNIKKFEAYFAFLEEPVLAQ